MTAVCSIVIPAHNGASLTGACLDALFADPPRVPFETIVVDDASSDGRAPVPDIHAHRVTTVARVRNGGFAAACNEGATKAAADYVVFLNNDTIPCAGWLDAALAYLRRHPRTAVVGSKLLYRNGTVQHAGAVLCHDGYPRHVYVGFPADHPAVCRSRRLQMVTAACALVRRAAFEQAGGFDTAFYNGFEDADLCLRLGELGHEIRYCHASVLYHDESASRERTAPLTLAAGERFRARWRGRARPDELDVYVDDGLVRVGHDGARLRIAVDPALGLATGGGEPTAVERLLHERSQQVLELLGETVRLTAALGGGQSDPVTPAVEARPAGDLARVHARADELEAEIHALQEELAAAVTRSAGAALPSQYLAYRRLVARVRRAVEDAVPATATVLVASRGDAALLRLGERCAWHFPQDRDRAYAGHHPADSSTAIAELERLRADGGEYLLLPQTMRWWLEHYPAFAEHLSTHCRTVLEEDACAIYALDDGA